MSTPSDLATQLLAAEAAEREQLLASASSVDLEQAVAALGRTRDPVAAELLSLLDERVADRAVRKAARRELHRLRSVGVQAPQRPSAAASDPAPELAPRSESLAYREVAASDFDGTGSRALWMLGERSLGGAWLAAFVLNDVQGVLEMHLQDTTRKRFRQDLDDRRRTLEGRIVSLPADYALTLIREGVDLVKARDEPLPTKYPTFRQLFGEAPAGPERALIYDTVSSLEVTFHPEWLAESPRLFLEPEVRTWSLQLPRDLRDRALEVASSTNAALVLPGGSPEQQALRLLGDAAQQSITPEVRRGLRRRLEETAYAFESSARAAQARLAVAAAQALSDTSAAAERHPLLRVLLTAALTRSIQSEQVGGRRASEVLLALIEKAFEREPEGGQEAAARPSGLILPR